MILIRLGNLRFWVRKYTRCNSDKIHTEDINGRVEGGQLNAKIRIFMKWGDLGLNFKFRG